MSKSTKPTVKFIFARRKKRKTEKGRHVHVRVISRKRKEDEEISRVARDCGFKREHFISLAVSFVCPRRLPRGYRKRKGGERLKTYESKLSL